MHSSPDLQSVVSCPVLTIASWPPYRLWFGLLNFTTHKKWNRERSFLLTAFLKYYSYTINFTLTAWNAVAFGMFTELCVGHHHRLGWPKHLFGFSKHLVEKPEQKNSPTCTNLIFSLWICLFWTFHVNGIARYAVCCDWSLSLVMSLFL